MDFGAMPPSPHRPKGPRFTVTEDQPGPQDVVVFTLSGELDHDTVPALREAVEQRLGPDVRRVLVDCSGITFCDSSGLNTLLKTRLAVQAEEAQFALVGVGGQLERVLGLTGTAEVFPRYASLEEALAGGSP
jgi:anti-anti-sigma factor